MNKALLLISLLMNVNILFSETYYIAPTGDDVNDGSIENPWSTIQKGHDMVQAGDTLYVRGGEYFPANQIKFTKDGNSNTFFVLSSYPGEIPIINGENIPDGDTQSGSTVTWLFSDANYWKIKGPIILTNGRGSGVLVDEGSFIEFDQIESSYNGQQASRAGHGFMVWTGDNITFTNCDAHHNANHLWKTGEDQEGNQFQHGDGWRIFTGENIVLNGCRSWHNLDDNYDILGTESPVQLTDCWAAYAGIDDSLGSITGVPGKVMPRIDGSNLLWGNGIKLGYNESFTQQNVIRCLSWGNNAAGFHMNIGPSRIINSASYNNKVFGFDYTDGNKHEIHNSWEFSNNYDNPGYNETIPDISLCSNNSWDDNSDFIVTSDDFISLDDAGMLAERQPNGGLPQTSFLRLVEGSDLVDAGADVGYAYNSDAPDIGVFESDYTTAISQKSSKILPEKFSLTGYPNPFNPNATIRYYLPTANYVIINVYDITGRKIIQLENDYKVAGFYKLSWNAHDASGHQVASGMYFIRIQAGKNVNSIKLTYLR